MTRASDTRKVYAWEDQFPAAPCGIRGLRRLVARVWRDLGPAGIRCPAVVAGRGVRYLGVRCSYCEGRSRIVLARQHRTRLVALHEVTHALGPVTHGRRFQNLYAELLMRYF